MSFAHVRAIDKSLESVAAKRNEKTMSFAHVRAIDKSLESVAAKRNEKTILIVVLSQ